MGQRGPQPSLKIRSEALDDLSAPSWLAVDGILFWERHAGQLAENQLLTRQPADSFAVLCDLWARLQRFRNLDTSRAFLDCQKAFTSLAKTFRLTPSEKPAVKEDRYADKMGIEF